MNSNNYTFDDFEKLEEKQAEELQKYEDEKALEKYEKWYLNEDR